MAPFETEWLQENAAEAVGRLLGIRLGGGFSMTSCRARWRPAVLTVLLHALLIGCFWHESKPTRVAPREKVVIVFAVPPKPRDPVPILEPKFPLAAAPTVIRQLWAVQRPRPISLPAPPRPVTSQPSMPDSLIVTANGVPAAATVGTGPAHVATGTGTAPAKAGDGDGRGGTMDAYLAKVRSLIQDAVRFPAAARRLGLSGRVFVHFAISDDGRVPENSVRLVGGDEDGLLEVEAVRIIRHLERLPPPPHGGIEVEVPVVFALSSAP
ncbi:TonB family protein [Telmatospirillum sp.]|uniref:energy transducer TonB n=1 Tax=Telmatospirillum sp. TaxID=2079197 RepID=UPI00284A3629|nr:TonB family protein [Telmatospirillum sp.]MDR3441372.1 TonB family protein [Telmatospirillum sp.]